MSIIEPEGSSTHGDGSTNNAAPSANTDEEQGGHCDVDDDGISVQDWVPDRSQQKYEDASKFELASAESIVSSDTETSRRDSISSGTYIPRGAPSGFSTGSPQSFRRRGRVNTYRLSMPPSIKFDALEPASRPLPVPQKSDLTSPTAYRPHPAYPVEEWTVQTPSPVKSFRDSKITLPLESRRGLGISGAGLMGVISSTWKRGVSSAQLARKVEVEEGARSVSY